MGKIILEFDSFEEAEEARTAFEAGRWKSAVWDLDQELRKITKYGFIDNKETTSEERDVADKLRTKLREILEENNLNLD